MAPIKKAKLNEDKHEVVSGQLAKKIKKAAIKEANKRGIVFIKNLPHGFFEQQLKEFFQQFGRVTRLRLARSKRTSRSKGFAFIEFEYPEIAQVVAATMNNYFMFNKVVKSCYIPPEKQKFNYFKSTIRQIKTRTGKKGFTSSKTAVTNKQAAHVNDWSEENYQKRASANLKKIKTLNAKYAHLGIDFSNYVVQPIKNGTNNTISDASKKEIKNKEKLLKNKGSSLSDLLENTIDDDSEDEEYKPSEESADEGTNESIDDIEDENEFDDNNTEFQSAPISKKKKSKPSKSDGIPKLVGRKLDEAVEQMTKFSQQLENARRKKKEKTTQKSSGNHGQSITDLLGNTIEDDSEDEEYIPSEGSSGEETIEDTKIEDNNDESIDENAEAELKPSLKTAKSKISNSDGFTKLIGRKLNGKIKKPVKKQLSQANAKKAKAVLKVEAAKELAKPLQQIRNKPKKVPGKKAK